ncbi:MAG TPA: hypothetical protein VL463_28125 [Kofleriaceae bacterium]|nr:hypothetical protein [Kofleriaceae bacterium]
MIAGCSHAHGRGGGDAGDDGDGGGTVDALSLPDVAPNASDPLPTGAISFFLATSCPSGWTSYDAAAGRAIVPSATDPTVTSGAPLARNEIRAHHHDAAIGVDLPSTSFAGIAGAANTGVAGAGHVDGAASITDGDAALPYVQLFACKKTAPPNGLSIPGGMVAFFESACPTGWLEAPAEWNGRMLVGLPNGGTPGATFGGAPLASGEARTHTHPYTGTVAIPSHGIALVSGCCAGGYASAGDRTISGTTGAGTVDLPYVQLRACVAP